MNIINKLREKQQNPKNAPGVTVAFLGDSITQGCFEIGRDASGNLKTVNDYENVYHAKFKKIFDKLYPDAPISIINAGISGTTSWEASERLEKDVIVHNPDLCVVSFAANDAHRDGGSRGEDFYNSLMDIAKRLKDNNIEVIFMSTAMNCTKISPEIKDEGFLKIAHSVREMQNSGTLKNFVKIMEKAATDAEVVFCDCYSKWEKLYESGVDIDNLLSNNINHPDREMHSLFAISLAESVFNN
ncbi:MAG: GDSL family lipase [Clostridia bacterium]|nr:GDSL family lipase [Clostridia bacterium]